MNSSELARLEVNLLAILAGVVALVASLIEFLS